MTRLFADGAPISVEVDPAGTPVRFQWQGDWLRVETVANRWRVSTSWWIQEARAEREYFKLIAGSMLCVIYRDLRAGDWYMSRIHD